MITKDQLENVFEEYKKKLENEENYQVYNIKDNEYPFLLQYHQLIEYLKYRNEINNYIKGWNLSPENDDLKRTMISTKKETNVQQNKYCLIDKKWIRKWRKHVGYEEIKNYFKNLGENIKIDDINNYKWIVEIIDKNSKDNLLCPLDNSSIYENNEVIPDSDFELINQKCYELFTIGAKRSFDKNNYKLLPVYFLNEKYIIILNDKLLLIVFKEKTKQIQFELLLIFEKISDTKKLILDDLLNKDINDWVNENGFDLSSDFEKTIKLYNCIITIINKSLKFKKKNSSLRNSCAPDLMCKRDTLLMENSISKDGLDLIKNQTYIMKKILLKKIKKILILLMLIKLKKKIIIMMKR